LETSLADYETKKIVKVTWLSEGITKEVTPFHCSLALGYF
jgi:hypothetical protein